VHPLAPLSALFSRPERTLSVGSCRLRRREASCYSSEENLKCGCFYRRSAVFGRTGDRHSLIE